MAAAAHTAGGFGGVPQKVGKEFVAADKAKGSPKSKADHMARRAKHMPQKAVAAEHGVHPSTVSRTLRRGFIGGAPAGPGASKIGKGNRNG